MISTELFAIGLPGVGEMAILAFIILLLFGGAKLPKLMRDLGSSAKEFKRGMAESEDESAPKEKQD